MTQQQDWKAEREAIRARWDADAVTPSTERRALQLVHSTREMLLSRIAKYNDPHNDEWNWDDVTDKWARHAYAAFRDLLTAEEDLRRLLDRDLENEREIERLCDLLQHDHFPSCSALTNAVDCDCGWNDGDKHPTDRITELESELASRDQRIKELEANP